MQQSSRAPLYLPKSIKDNWYSQAVECFRLYAIFRASVYLIFAYSLLINFTTKLVVLKIMKTSQQISMDEDEVILAFEKLQQSIFDDALPIVFGKIIFLKAGKGKFNWKQQQNILNAQIKSQAIGSSMQNNFREVDEQQINFQTFHEQLEKAYEDRGQQIYANQSHEYSING